MSDSVAATALAGEIDVIQRRMTRPATPSVPSRLLWACGIALVAVGGCGRAAAESPGGAELSGALTVFAAASLTDAFEEVGAAFTAQHPGVDVTFNFAGSQTLASQINDGAPADVFASADARQMAVVAAAGNLAAEPEVFTANRLAIAVAPGNPLAIAGLADLANPELLLVLPAAEVPAGRYARAALEAAGVTVTPASLEGDVRAALSKVALGEADAAIVYASDVAASGDRVDAIDIPRDVDVAATYPIATLTSAPNPDAAAAFMHYVLAADGQRILQKHGFTPP